MLFIKYSKDGKKLLEIMETDRTRFENLERRAADVISAVTGTGLDYEEGDGTVNMCKAIQDIKQEAYDKGEQNGMLKKAEEMARNCYKMGMGVDEISQAAGYTGDVIRQWLGLADMQ